MNNKLSVIVCFALKEEAAPFRKIATGRAASAQAGISILLTGIGRQNIFP
ncbi:MAG TPA: hypothetical protein VFC17_05610 [Candidatus Limnocylindrales bacterium]|nr:hypothetical protein [Candidatus Limnocylindrales bacterium]